MVVRGKERQMPYLDHSAQITAVVLFLIFVPGLILALAGIWASYRTRLKGIDALKAYAERGQEPPAALLEALRPVVPPSPIPRRQTRGELLSQFAFAIVMSLGAAGLAWWCGPEHHGSPGLALGAVIAAIVFAGIAASMLVGALTTRDGD
jgi:hypothetical protein